MGMGELWAFVVFRVWELEVQYGEFVCLTCNLDHIYRVFKKNGSV
jgi:hypothetical protein